MIAYHNDPDLKARFVSALKWHRAQDMIAAGSYHNREHNTFCAVGCSIHSLDPKAELFDDHAAYERLIGVPQMLARLQDGIFEGLPDEGRPGFVVAFGKSIPVGADLSLVGWQFLDRMLRRAFARIDADDPVHIGCAAALDIVSQKSRAEQVAESAAYNAAASAASAADSAADSAARAAARAADSAASAAGAAYSTARAAARAADAESAAYNAADSAASAASNAADSASSAERLQQAGDLCELLASAPMSTIASVSA